MSRGVSIALVIILAGAISSAAVGDEYYLYKPEKAQTQNIPTPGEGVLTKTITIQRGDTLTKLSRKFSSRGAFFPQILLFNRIKNPDLIYAGAQLRVPLTQPAALSGAAVEEKRGKAQAREPGAGKSAATHHKQRKAPAPAAAAGKAGQRLFKQGVTAFATGHYRKALNIFDRYLATYPNSPDAAEAALYRAECYMKLSGD
ncbi:MAG TPA: LysM peptidoglycan-binding domain-containing protein [Geobacteraceae bacterium]|nr:LysM peptidoglycan-binding domain-containing protein [Geobacteraceae bacterium]